ncbi:MAG: CoA transferase [Deltaproteobacteria bacterium]|nr:CoA transferase [Deltaproteobacteria bacterium]
MSGGADKSNHRGLLEGIRVLEYGVFHAGPGASAILGDLGAEVIKIEAGMGDPERYWVRVGNLDFSLPNGDNVIFHASNRNKRGIYLDIEKPEGRAVFHRLVEESDVFLTNLRKSTKKKMGLDYETISRINPRIIHANVSGFGPEGPMSDMGAFDPLGLARSGLMFVTGNDDPVMMHVGILDQATAITASHAVLAALLAREREGKGREVHVSLYSAGQWLMYPNLMLSNLLGVDPNVRSDRIEHSPLRNLFRCKDGKWIIGTHHPEDRYWPAFCEATGQEDLLSDPRYADEEARAAHCAELVAHFDRVFATKTRDEWMEIFLARGLMFCSVQHVSEIRDDPQARANGYVEELEDPVLGRVTVPGYPARFSAARVGTRALAPSMGRDTHAVLAEIGYSDEEIENLRAKGVIR